MPRLLSNRKPVSRPEDLKDNRWEYLNLQQAQPALGLAPQNETGYTLQTDDTGKVTYSNTLGKLSFLEQTITPTLADTDITIDGTSKNSNIILTPFQKVQVGGNLEVDQNATITGDLTVTGVPLGTFPINPNTLYVTPNGDDRNDGTALDASRACRTVSGAVRSPHYKSGTAIKVAAGTYFEDNPIPLKPYTSVVGNDLRTTFLEPLNKDLDLFHVNSGVYIAQMQMRNLRRGGVERYAPGGAGTYTTGAYCVAFPPSLDNPIDLYYSPYIQNCTNQSGPWLRDGTMFVPNQTVQVPLAAGTSTWVGSSTQITITLYTGTISVGMAVNDAANEGYRNAQLLLQRNREFLQRQTFGFVKSTYPSLQFNEAFCYRDVGLIVDAVSGDARFGGNKRSIEAGLAYWSGNTTIIAGEQTETGAAIDYLKSIALDVIINNTVTSLYDTTVDQLIDLNLDNGQVVTTRVTNSFNLIKTIMQNGEDSVPSTVEDLLGLIYPTGLSPNSVNVASTITAITTVSSNVYTITLSTSTVSPSDNATVYFGYTSVYPILDADIPTTWTVDDGYQFADRRLDPTGAGGGALVDGNAPSLRSPIQSFVFDAFTQLNQGGNGIHIINNGYAQLVSVFTIFCANSVLVEGGGIASITNSNANFGDQCLTAKGLGKLAFGGFIRNDAYPTNVPNGEYYPLGYWPQKQIMEVFLPSDRDRPHIGQVMEVVAPDTYIDYSGNRVTYVNEVGYPGYLVATSNTGSISTGSYTISGIDVSNIAVGHNLYIRDIYGSEVSSNNGQPYVTTGTQVVDVNYLSITLNRPILNGFSDSENANFFNLYFCGSAYYTVLSSTIDSSLSSTVTNQTTLVPGQESTTSLAISFAKNLALRIIQNVPATGFVYNKTKCARDTGIIVDSIISDLLFDDNGYTQSQFSGLQYWNQAGYTGAIASELTTTTNAINFVSGLAQEIVQHITTGTRYTTTATQSLIPPTATGAEADAIAADFAVITDILTSGTAGVTDIIVANGTSIVSANAEKAYNLLQANKQYIQEQAVAHVENSKTYGFEYDMSLCYRDVGYMVDGVGFDILYGGNRQAIQSGVYYYGFSGSSSAIMGESAQTIASYNRLKTILSDIVTNTIITPSSTNTATQVINLTTSTELVGSTITNIVNVITNIIKNGPTAAAPKTSISQTKSADADRNNATAILAANRNFIVSEITAYVDQTYGKGFVYNQAKCKRDTGLVVDSIALDVLYPTATLSQSNFTGLQYWNQDAYTGNIAEELTTTTNAINYVKALAKEVIQGITTGTRYQSTVSQNIATTFATSVEADIVAEDFATIVDILVDGIAGVTDRIVTNGEESSSTNLVNAYTLLMNNKTYIQREALAFIENTKFTYNQSKCYRDSGLIVDSIAIDLLYPSDDKSQSTFTGLQYWNQGGYTGRIASELTTTTNAINYVSALAQKIVRNITTGTRYQSTIVQNTSLPAATINEANAIAADFSIITGILTGGTTGVTDSIMPNDVEESADVDVQRAYALLQANKEYLAAEAVAWVEYNRSGGYNQSKCLRDTGIILDSVVMDILFPTTNDSQLTFAGLQYWNQNGYTGLIESELTTTTNAINYVKSLAQKIVVNDVTGLRYQSSVGQVTGSAASAAEVTIIGDEFTIITDILTGGTAGVTDLIIGNNTTASDVTTVINAYDLLIANIDYLKAEAIAYIDDQNPGFTYNSTTCARDVEYIVNSIAFDLLYSGNRQAIQSAVYYYSFNASSSAIPGEVTQTVAAFDYMKTISQQIIQNIPVTGYQLAVAQVTSLSPSSAGIAATIGQKFEDLTLIISDGPSVVSTKEPISLTRSTSTNTLAAVEILEANREFIKAEVIAFIERIFAYQYNRDVCFRDVEYMVDSVSFDLLHNGNRQAVQSGVYYYTFDENSTAIPNEIPQTTAAYNFISELAQRVVLNQTGINYQSTVTQVTSLTSATVFEAELLAENISVITNIINNGPGVVAAKTPVPLTASSDENKLNAAKILAANRLYIQAETVAYVNQTQIFEFDRSLCYRDVGYMVDSVAFDLLHPAGDVPSNRQAIQSGVYYFGYNSTSTVIAGEIPQTTIAYNHIKSLVPYIVQGITVQSPYQDFVKQVVNLTTASSAIVADIQANVDHIVNIINNGPTAAYAKTPIAMEQTPDADALNAYNLLIANKEFIKEELIALINASNPSGTYQKAIHQVFDQTLSGGEDAIESLGAKFDIISNIVKSGADSSPAISRPRQYLDANQNILNAKELLEKNRQFIQAETVAFVDNIWPSKFTYDPAKCIRDTGLIVDALAQDLLFEGSSQSAFSAIQYWNQGTTVIPGEQITTTNAISYLKEIATKIITNDTSGYRYYDGGYTYNRVKCSRDTGLIVDALVQDLLFGGTSQSEFSAIQYWNQGGYTGLISTEITTTTNAINYVADLSRRVVQNITTGTRYQFTVTQNTVLPAATAAEGLTIVDDFAVIVDILENGTVGITDRIVPNSIEAITLPAVVRAYNLLVANKEYIQAEAVAFVEDQKTPGFVYDSGLCYRDVGYIVDSVAFDLIYGGNRQAIQSGVYYYSYNSASTAVPNEIPQVTSAYDYIKSVIPYIVQGITTSTYQIEVSQVTNLTTSTLTEAVMLQNNVDIINNIIANGPGEITAKTPIGSTASSTASIVNAATIMLANRAFIVAETNAYIDNKFNTGFIYDYNKCQRDTGLIVDSLAFDLLYGGTSQSTFSAIQYWAQDGYTGAIASELTTTTAAVSYLKSAISDIVYTAGGSVPQLSVDTNFNTVLNIINSGTVGVTDIIVPNGPASTNAGIVAAFDAIQSSKTVLINQTIDWINSNNGFVYDSIKCSRDTGIIIDDIAMDLMFESTSQSTFSGIQYWNHGSYVGAIASELTTTTNAVNYLKSLAQKVIVNDTSGPRYQIVVSQDTGLTAASTTEQTLIGDDFDVITNILTTGVDGVTDLIVSNSITSSTVATVKNAFAILQANKAYLQAEVVAYVEDQKTPGFTYDQSKCSRDAGFMVDSVSIDLLYGGNRQAIQSGVYYYSFNGSSTALPGEQTQSVAAYNYIKSIIPYIIQGIAVFNPYQSTVSQITSGTHGNTSISSTAQDKIDVITDIITNGPSVAATGIPLPVAPTNDQSALNAAAMLKSNKAFIVAETIAYINSTYNGFAYNQTLCRRDLGFILDSVSFDLLHGGNRQSIMSSVYYYGYDASSIVIAEVPQATAAYSYIKSIIDDIIQGNQIIDVYQTTVNQEIDLPPGSSVESVAVQANVDLITTIINEGPATAPAKEPIGLTISTSTYVQNAFNMILANREFIKAEVVAYVETVFDGTPKQITGATTATAATISAVTNDLDLIINILTNGTAGITDQIVPNRLTASTSTNVINAYNLLQANKKYLQKEIVAYVDQNSNFIYNQDKCARDLGLIVDAVALDLLYPTPYDSQSTFAGIQYWNQNGYTGAIAQELTTTTNAINYLSSLAQKVVVNNKSGTRYQSTLTQTTSTLVGTVNEAVSIGTDFGVITDILTNGTSGVTDDIVANGRPSIDENIVNAYSLLLANKNYLIAEVISYVESTNGFTYDKTRCSRDSGVIVDSVISDIMFPTTNDSQTTFAGLQYWNHNGYTGFIAEELTTTTNAINYIKSVAQQVIVNATGTRYQSFVEQTTGTVATANEVNIIGNEFDIITDILTNGTNGVTDLMIGNGITASTTASINRAYTLLQANKAYLQAEAIAYIDATTPVDYVYNPTTCLRDVGYMVDSVSFDLLYGGNRQAIQSGVYYYSFNGSSTAIPNEITQTLSAFTHIKMISQQIIQNQTVSAYQTAITQVKSLPASSREVATSIGQKFNVITGIISNGPASVAAMEILDEDAQLEKPENRVLTNQMHKMKSNTLNWGSIS
jgi:hypothetical protein